MSKSIKITILVFIIIIILAGGIIILNKKENSNISTKNNVNTENTYNQGSNNIIANNQNSSNINSEQTWQNDSSITFGRYYINGSELEPIEWVVLDEKDGKKLLISKYAINSVPFNNTLQSTTWNDSDIRNWLNGEFYNIAFSEEEKNQIILTKNIAEENPNHSDMPTGNDTEDNVFLLSYQEIMKYLPEKSDRLLKPTKYSIEQGCYTNQDGNVAWWTRSAGISETSPEYIASNGDFGNRQHQVNEKIIGTRPAIWIKSN